MTHPQPRFDTRGVVFDGGHGNHPAIVGEQRFGAAVVPGVAGPDGIFKDTRSEPYGPISQKLARWDGMAVDGMAVQLDYTVLGTRVHEQPSSVASGGDVAFVRVIQVDPPKGGGLLKRQRTPETFSLLLATVKGGTISVDQTKGAAFATWKGEDGAELHVAATALPANASVRAKDGHIALDGHRALADDVALQLDERCAVEGHLDAGQRYTKRLDGHLERQLGREQLLHERVVDRDHDVGGREQRLAGVDAGSDVAQAVDLALDHHLLLAQRPGALVAVVVFAGDGGQGQCRSNQPRAHAPRDRRPHHTPSVSGPARGCARRRRRAPGR